MQSRKNVRKVPAMGLLSFDSLPRVTFGESKELGLWALLLCDRCQEPYSLPPKNASWFQKSVMNAKLLLEHGLRNRVGKGRTGYLAT